MSVKYHYVVRESARFPNVEKSSKEFFYEKKFYNEDLPEARRQAMDHLVERMNWYIEFNGEDESQNDFYPLEFLLVRTVIHDIPIVLDSNEFGDSVGQMIEDDIYRELGLPTDCL